ncbi:MAG TPA: PAS domain S-box protein [Thermoanaerobaculia bacterium]|jgi:PAS domain S-box-containing protein
MSARETDAAIERAVLRNLLTETLAAYEERLNAFRAEKELVRHLLAEMAEAVFLTDASGALTRLNPAAEKLTGWSAAEARGRGLGNVLRLVSHGQRVALDLAPCLAEGRQLTLRRDLRVVDREGRTRSVTGRASPIRGRQGVLGAVLVLSADPASLPG